MENFSREKNGYSPREVDEFLQRMRREHQEKTRQQSERIFELKQEMNSLKYSLGTYKDKEAQVSKALIAAVQKAKEIENSARSVYELEIKRVQLLYNKWERLLNELRTKFGNILPGNEIDNMVGDFQYALTITLESTLTSTGERKYSKSVLERMQHSMPTVNNGKVDPNVTLKETEIRVQYDQEGQRISQITRHLNSEDMAMEETPAEKFLNGEQVELPKSMGRTGPNVLQLPPQEFAEALNQTQNGFNMREALSPKESLEEIMRAFNIVTSDDDQNL